jgi:decaprenyl-phosphate phosphoribosyltransferase
MASKIKSILQLLRVRQYYKNIIMFLGVFFGGKLFSFDLYGDLIIGFILLCFISSINYIINDILDIEKDKQHPEKRLKRPLASGAMKKYEAYILLCILIAIEIYYIIRFFNLFLDYFDIIYNII